MTQKIVVIGASGMGREVLDIIEAMQKVGQDVQILGVVDDLPSKLNLNRLLARGYDYLGTIAQVIDQGQPADYIIGIAAPAVRRSVASRMDAAGWHAISVVHPTSSIGSEVTLESGVIVCAGVRLTTNILLERHVLLNSNVTVGHDTSFGAFGTANPGAHISGDVVLAPGVLVGTGATVLQGLQIGQGAVVGANACVTKRVPQGVTVVGVPARVRQENTP